MLSDDELLRIAATYAKAYHAGNPARKLKHLSVPNGGFFAVDRIYEAAGDAGFFVSSDDGRVIQLGSGDFTHLLLELGPNRFAETDQNDLLTRILLAKLQLPRPGPDKYGLIVG